MSSAGDVATGLVELGVGFGVTKAILSGNKTRKQRKKRRSRNSRRLQR